MNNLEYDLQLFSKFLKGKSENTIYNYCITIRQLYKWLDDNNYIEDVFDDEDVDKDKLEYIFEDFKRDVLSDNDYEIKTINCKCDGINSYLKFKNIDFHVEREKIQSQSFINDMLTNEELKSIAICAKERGDYRTYALIHSLFYTGARISELLQLRVKDTTKSEVMIGGKGKKFRKIFIPDKMRDVLTEYLEHHRLDTDKTALFTGERGALTRTTVNKSLKRYFKILDYDEDKMLTPHVIRHIFTKNLMSKGVSISAIKQLLGHSLTTTDIYGQLSKRELMEILDGLDF